MRSGHDGDRKGTVADRDGLQSPVPDEALLDYFVQTTHPGTIQLQGDTASGRTYICEPGRFRDSSSELNYAVCHDRYRRTPDGWKFTERVYQVRYLDTTTPAGSPPRGAL